MNQFLILNLKDNVAVALSELAAGQEIKVDSESGPGTLQLKDNIQFGHKFALKSLNPGDEVIKYGHVIGMACQPVAPGQHVHTHNVESIRARGDK